ncbi:hypothetical protein HAX54_051140, partial [Datura stramonium]|nr:hypothetical protein [Datura stramonium]
MSMTVDGEEEVFDVFREAQWLPHYEELKTIMVVEPKMSKEALGKYLSHEDPLGRAFIHEKEKVDSLEVAECLEVLDATKSYNRRGSSLETLDRPLAWEKQKPSTEKA